MQINKYDVVSPFFNIYGNCSLNKAEVVIVADVPYHPLCQPQTVSLINEIWQQHLILIENEEKGKSIPRDKYELKFGDVQGCDLQHLSGNIPEWIKQEKKIRRLISKIEFDIAKYSTNFNKEHVLKNLKNLMELACKISIPVAELGFDKLKERYDKFLHIPMNSYREFLEQVYSIAHSVAGEFHFGIRKFHKTTFSTRHKLFKESIENGLKSHKKVIALLNISHVVSNPRLIKEGYDKPELEEYLKTKKFVILNFKNHFLNVPDTPSLWQDSSSVQIEEKKKTVLPSYVNAQNQKLEQKESKSPSTQFEFSPKTIKKSTSAFILERLKFYSQQLDVDGQGKGTLKKSKFHLSLSSLSTPKGTN